MAYTFISHGSGHIEIASDDRQRFRFCIVHDEDGRASVVCRARWENDRLVEGREPVGLDVARFASACAVDAGLM